MEILPVPFSGDLHITEMPLENYSFCDLRTVHVFTFTGQERINQDEAEEIDKTVISGLPGETCFRHLIFYKLLFL